MPALVDRCVKKLIAKGYSKDSAWAICLKSTGYRKKDGKWVKTKEK